MVTREQARDRGQLILIGAVLVALTIVASVVLLNSIHASADVRAQQDKQNLQQAERVTGQVQTNLNTLFVKNGSEKSVGEGRYIINGNESRFAALVDDYNSQYLNLSSTTQSGFVNVTFDASDSVRGDVVYQNETNSLAGWRLHGGSPVSIAYLYLNVTSANDATIQVSGAPNAIEITNSGPHDIEVNGDTKCSGVTISPSQPLQINLVQGVGTITGDSCEVTVDLSSEFESVANVRFSGTTIQGTTTATFTGDASPNNMGVDYRGKEDDAIVYPNFKISYQNPSVSYESNVTIGGDS